MEQNELVPKFPRRARRCENSRAMIAGSGALQRVSVAASATLSDVRREAGVAPSAPLYSDEACCDAFAEVLAPTLARVCRFGAFLVLLLLRFEKSVATFVSFTGSFETAACAGDALRAGSLERSAVGAVRVLTRLSPRKRRFERERERERPWERYSRRRVRGVLRSRGGRGAAGGHGHSLLLAVSGAERHAIIAPHAASLARQWPPRQRKNAPRRLASRMGAFVRCASRPHLECALVARFDAPQTPRQERERERDLLRQKQVRTFDDMSDATFDVSAAAGGTAAAPTFRDFPTFRPTGVREAKEEEASLFGERALEGQATGAASARSSTRTPSRASPTRARAASAPTARASRSSSAASSRPEPRLARARKIACSNR